LKTIINLAVLLSLSCLCFAGVEQLVQVKGTRVGLAPPQGFIPAERFPGFQAPDAWASIMVSEMKAPFSQAGKGFNQDGFARHGMTLIESKEAQFGDFRGYLFLVAQDAQGKPFTKWIAAFGNDQHTWVITATFPKDSEQQLSNEMRKAMLSSRVVTERADPSEGLTFEISPVGDMKVANIGMNAITLTKGGTYPVPEAGYPNVIAAASFRGDLAPIPDKKAFALKRLQSLPTLTNIEQEKTEAVSVDGLDGYETVGHATHAKSGKQVALYQMMLFESSEYYCVAGTVVKEESAQYLNLFKDIARTFKRKNARKASEAEPNTRKSSP
jgi:hypothetical protein